MTAAAPPAPRSSLLGSLKDALAAASKDDTGAGVPRVVAAIPPPIPEAVAKPGESASDAPEARDAAPHSPSAAEAAREARGVRVIEERHLESDRPPTTRVVRSPKPAVAQAEPDAPARTSLVRGKQQVRRGAFEQDPVVGWLVIVGGPGIGQFRPVFEGNNTIGRTPANRIAIDFGDDAISSDEQAYIRYDSSDRSFLFVPNLAKTNVVSVNDKRPTSAVELASMDVITMGRTQLVFVPFCGPEFDWAALAEG